MNMATNDTIPQYGILWEGKFYELSERGCAHCDLYKNACYDGIELCDGFPFPNPEKDHCFRFSQEITDKINGK